MLSAMVVCAGNPVSTEALADALWGDQPPVTWTKVVQGSVVRLRKRLGSASIESTAARLPPRPRRRRARPPGLRAAARTGAGGARRRRPGAVVVPGPGGAAAVAGTGATRTWRSGRRGRSRPAGSRACGWTPRRCWSRRRSDAGRARDVVERARALVAAGAVPGAPAGSCWHARCTGPGGGRRRSARSSALGRCWSRVRAGSRAVSWSSSRRMLLRQDPSLRPRSSPEVSATCPYRGLLPYDAADADSFFGREDDTAACLRRLRDSGVLTVIGPSGVGKSSLVRAGVVARLVRERDPGAGHHARRTPDGLAGRAEAAGPADPGGGPGRGGGHASAPTRPSGRGTSRPWRAARGRRRRRWCSRCGPTTWATWRRTRRSPGVLEDGLYLLGPMSEPELRERDRRPGSARRAAARAGPGRPAGPRGRGRARRAAAALPRAA